MKKWIPIAEMIMNKEENAIFVTPLDSPYILAQEVVYVWTLPSAKWEDSEWVRVGTSQKPVFQRLKDYEKHLTAALNGNYRYAPESEIIRWKEALKRKKLIAIVHIPDEIATVAGSLKPFLDIERVLIKQCRKKYGDKLFNRSHR